MVVLPVPSQRSTVNPVRPGREQPKRLHRVPRCGWWGCLHHLFGIAQYLSSGQSSFRPNQSAYLPAKRIAVQPPAACVFPVLLNGSSDSLITAKGCHRLDKCTCKNVVPIGLRTNSGQLRAAPVSEALTAASRRGS